jgi:hypothetical protein
MLSVCMGALPLARRAPRKLRSDDQVTLMPAWLGDVAARWASLHLRLHVLFQAAGGPAATVPLSLESGGAASAVADQRTNDARIRYCVKFHSSCTACVCGLSRGTAATARDRDTFRHASLAFEFCARQVTNSTKTACGTHTWAVRPPSALAARVCGAQPSLVLRCIHTSEGGNVTTQTVIDLPTTHPYLRALAGAVSELCEPDANVDEIRKLLVDAFVSSIPTAPTRLALVQTDAVALAMLSEGSFVFAKKSSRCASKTVHARDGKKALSAKLTGVATSHAHLFPSH